MPHADSPAGSSLPFNQSKPISEMSLVDIAEQLERVTSWIEAERVKERDARKVYQQIADRVEENVKQIRSYAQDLVNAQARKMNAFSGMITPAEAIKLGVEKPARSGRGGGKAAKASGTGEIRNIQDAILAIWEISGYNDPLTTEEIADALPETGYTSNAAPSSLKSSVNQALAKLSKAGQILRYRGDGERIPDRDTRSRARKYMAAAHADE